MLTNPGGPAGIDPKGSTTPGSRGRWTEGFRRGVGSTVLALCLVAGASCVSTMKRYEGHQVFNPVYLFYLESKSRDAWQKPDEVLQALGVAEGLVVADIGAGGGYFTEKLSRRVGASGRVYATDVQPVMIKKLRKRISQAGLTNVMVIHAPFDDPALPLGACDLAFFSSVYKEIDARQDYMRKLRLALKPGGRVAIIEYRPDDPNPGPPRRYRLADSQVITEMAGAGFALQERFDFLPREYLLVFRPAVAPGREESETSQTGTRSR